MKFLNFILSFFGKAKNSPVEAEIPLTDEQKYWRWWNSQDTPEIGEIKHPKFDENGKRIPGEFIIGYCHYTE